MPITFKEALDFVTKKKVVLPEVYYGTLQQKSRGRAFSIAGIASRDQLQSVLDSLNAVLRQGTTFDEWKKLASTEALGLSPDRLDNIFRTNMQSAYNAGHWTQQQQVKLQRPYLMYDAINDSRTRPSHLALDNVIKRIDDPFWNTYYPPNGFRCRCSTINLTEGQAKARGGVTVDPADGWPPTDKGWDYNGADIDEGISRGARSTARGNTGLQRAMERLVSEQTELDEAKAEAKKTTFKKASPNTIKAWFTSNIPPELAEMVDIVSWGLFGHEWDARVFNTPLSGLVLGTPDSMVLVSIEGNVRAAGQYNSFRHVMRVNVEYVGRRYLEDILVHEMGHHLDFTMLMKAEFAGLRAELVADLHAIYKAASKQGVEVAELVAMPSEKRSAELSNMGILHVSGYAVTNEMEWIAESFYEYYRRPDRLKMVAPRTYAAFEELRTGGAFQ